MRISKKKAAEAAVAVDTSAAVSAPEASRNGGTIQDIASTGRPTETSTDLVLVSAIAAIVPAEFFRPDGSRAVLDKLKTEVRKQADALDTSTEQGRQATASLAYKVARSKTALDEQGKKLVVDIKAQAGVIDKERSKVWDEMEALQKEVRQPLDDYERIEKERVAAHEGALNEIATAELRAFLLNDDASIETKVRLVEEIYNGRNWQEFAKRASTARAAALMQLGARAAKIRADAAEKAEAARLQAEEAERVAREREEAAAKTAREEELRKAVERERLAHEAAEQRERQIHQERIEAEARAAQAEAQRVAAEAKAAQDLLDAEKRRRQELLDAENLRVREADYAERKRVAAEKESQRQLDLAAQKAERDRVAAVQAERDRVVAERRKLEEAHAKRERDKKHVAKINQEVMHALENHCQLLFPFTETVVDAIAKGLIPHVTINY